MRELNPIEQAIVEVLSEETTSLPYEFHGEIFLDIDGSVPVSHMAEMIRRAIDVSR